jgi:glycosyltransferase involved in cell wall biosynthesis
LFFLGFPNPFHGAAWSRIGFFAENWSGKGHSIEVLGTFGYKTLHKRGIRRICDINISNLIFGIGLNHPLVFTLNGFAAFVVSTLFLLIRKPNAAIASVPPGDAGLGTLMACRLTRTKCVVDYRDEWEDYAISFINRKVGKIFYSFVRKLAARLYARSQLVVAVTPNFATSLKARGITDVRLVWNGADTKIFRPSKNERKDQAFTLFYMGSVGAYYRLDKAIQSIRILVDKGAMNVKLVIAGSGEVQKLLNLASKLGVSDNIKYEGVINDKARLANRAAGAYLGLIPYDNNPLWKNSIPAKFFEYCACGIPVTATVYEDSLLAALIREHGIGTTSPPMDEEKLAEAIYRIYHDSPFRETAGRKARALVEKEFDRAKIAEHFLKLIETVI